MTRVVLRPEAVAEFKAAVEWYESKETGLGRQFTEAVDAAIGRVAESPLRAPVWKAGHSYRRIVVRRFPFVIIFNAQKDQTVVVLAVAHMHRRPGYWMNR